MRPVAPAESWSKIHRYVRSKPSARLIFGSQSYSSLNIVLSLLRPFDALGGIRAYTDA